MLSRYGMDANVVRHGYKHSYGIDAYVVWYLAPGMNQIFARYGCLRGMVWMQTWYVMDTKIVCYLVPGYEPNICSVWMHSRYGMDTNMVRYGCGMDANMVRCRCIHYMVPGTWYEPNFC